ncbi:MULTISPECIES: hypothetical protein [Myxococcus]|uniref:hypothetical protein n=1 Tax=Myxococcus TaxID=32 RepID=UPI001E455907|nr:MULTISPECIES: hypothetical protein [Myxococcus]MCK8498816.1 hypothetical protein [Myxococcus fulvus]
MPKPQLYLLLAAWMAQGGAIPALSVSDAGVSPPVVLVPQVDAGPRDAGTPDGVSIPWPQEELSPLATLDGPAVLAAHDVLEQVLKQRFAKDAGRSCVFSPRALDVLITQKDGWYFVRVNRRVDRCPGFGPGVSLETDWFELYAVSPEGRVERYPYHP